MLKEKNSRELLELDFTFKNPLHQKLYATVEWPLKKVLALNRINRVYERISNFPDSIYFTDRVLRALSIGYEVSEEDRDKIPRTGPVVVVANHPFGGIEGIILASLLNSVRRDIKLMANFILGHIPEMREILILVDPFGTSRSAAFNMRPIKESLAWLKDGHMLGVFPAGEVSHIHLHTREITDPPWNHTIARLIQKSGATVLPVFFKGFNSPLFQTLGLVHPRVRTLLLPREVLKKRRKTIKVGVGTPISYKKLARFTSEKDLTSYLRLRTYTLKNRRITMRPARKLRLRKIVGRKRLAPIVQAQDSDVVVREVSNLPSDNLLVDGGDFRVYRTTAQEAPGVLREIGRLREITFRMVNEGTGKPLDLDLFDNYYTHLFLWSSKNNEVVGSYRSCNVDDVKDQQGTMGLYTSSLFRYDPTFFNHVTPALELGRSFVRPEYQRNYSALMLLWKGIGALVVQNPKIRYLFGPVSINDAYQPISRELMISCLSSKEHRSDLSGLVKAKKPPQRIRKREFESSLGQTLIRELEEVSSLIADVESDQKSLPILMKQYLKLGGKLLCFNIDPAFHQCLDGLILVDLRKTPPKILERYMGKEGAAVYRKSNNL